MRRLTKAQSDALLAVMRKAAKKPFDERQALWDLEAILNVLPLWVEAANRPRKQGGKKPLSVLVEAAGDVYHKHTGNLPGNTTEAIWETGKKRKVGGCYPAFIAILAEAASIHGTPSAIGYACNQARKTLNVYAGNNEKKTKPRKGEAPRPKSSRAIKTDKVERKKACDNLLDTHVAYLDDDSDPVLGGYEPGRDPDLNPLKAFAHLLKKA